MRGVAPMLFGVNTTAFSVRTCCDSESSEMMETGYDGLSDESNNVQSSCMNITVRLLQT
jgi:hypothetical protein